MADIVCMNTLNHFLPAATVAVLSFGFSFALSMANQAATRLRNLEHDYEVLAADDQAEVYAELQDRFAYYQQGRY